MYAERHTVAITTASGGTATGYTPPVSGKVISIRYVKTDFDDTADFTITGEDTGMNIWTELNVTASKTCVPRQATHDTAGVATLYAAAGAAVLDHIVLAKERVKIAIAQGGNTKSGTS